MLLREILRVYGYDNIENKVDTKNINWISLSNKQKNLRRLKKENMLAGFGLNEVITYSLVSEKFISFPQIGKKVEILMPLSDDRHLLKTINHAGTIKNIKLSSITSN